MRTTSEQTTARALRVDAAAVLLRHISRSHVEEFIGELVLAVAPHPASSAFSSEGRPTASSTLGCDGGDAETDVYDKECGYDDERTSGS